MEILWPHKDLLNSESAPDLARRSTTTLLKYIISSICNMEVYISCLAGRHRMTTKHYWSQAAIAGLQPFLWFLFRRGPNYLVLSFLRHPGQWIYIFLVERKKCHRKQKKLNSNQKNTRELGMSNLFPCVLFRCSWCWHGSKYSCCLKPSSLQLLYCFSFTVIDKQC